MAGLSPELLAAVMQPDDTVLVDWIVVDGIFHGKQLACVVYVDVDYHTLIQGDLIVMKYCNKLKSFTLASP